MSTVTAASPARRTRIGVVPPGTEPPFGVRRLVVLLIKPSRYDDDGYVMRYVRGVLPSNTLATLAALTEDVAERGDLGDLRVETRMMDEHVQKIDARRIARKVRRRGMRAVVALCGVQSNQFPRAADLAREFRAAGIPVMIGGFHVSGAIAMSPAGMPAECQALLDDGITLVKGEVEECWGDLLRDALHGRLAAFYDVVAPPDLSRARIPVVDPRLMKRYAVPRMGTIDAARGCPFSCSFCTIINVQGRKMRHRSAEQIKDRIRRNRSMNIDYYFFTDDNFARNPVRDEILDALIALRCEEGVAVQFMMQVDTLAHRIPGFVAKAAAAGCSQVFIGVESLDPRNLLASGKRQNNVEDYRAMVDAWHSAGIACHAAFIIGFPHDTAESVGRDVVRLRDEVGADQASFFMYTPIPGSADHREMVLRNEPMDEDLNRYDSFHPTIDHPRMGRDEWFGAYRRAWRDFYSVDGMKSILTRANDVTYWGLFKNFVWYKYATEVEGTHPMIGGFFRMKDRRQRRPGIPVESWGAHRTRRVRDFVAWLRGVRALYFEMQEVWLATRGSAQLQRSLDEWKRRYEGMRDRLEASASRAAQSIRDNAAGVRRFNPFAIRARTRADLDAYWRQTFEKLRRGRVYAIDPLRLALNFLRDLKLCVRFNLSFFSAYGK